MARRLKIHVLDVNMIRRIGFKKFAMSTGVINGLMTNRYLVRIIS